MVMVEGEHCRWCKKMKGRTLTDDAVEKRLRKICCCKSDERRWQCYGETTSRGRSTHYIFHERR